MSGNTCNGNTWYGIYINNSDNNNITGNTCNGNTWHGILFDNSHNNNITGNTCNGNTRHGIYLYWSDNCNITGNVCIGNDAHDTGTYDGININTHSDDNLVQGNICNDNDRYGIRINSADCDRNWVKDNQLRGNTSAPFSDAGTDTKLATVKLQFVDGTTFLSTAPFGWEIDAEAEYAIALGTLPLEVQQVIRWRIKAVSLVDEAHGMELEVEGYGWADNEPYTTETVAVASKGSDTTNFSNGDGVTWILTPSDDADIGHMVGGDTVAVKVLHEAADGDNCETDAVFLCVEIEIV
jgi:parallel beta-helix repeat protein